jgi:hypothetical protein
MHKLTFPCRFVPHLILNKPFSTELHILRAVHNSFWIKKKKKLTIMARKRAKEI